MSVQEIEKAIAQLGSDEVTELSNWLIAFKAQALIPRSKRAVVDIVNTLPSGPRSAPSWELLDRQLSAERDAWD